MAPAYLFTCHPKAKAYPRPLMAALLGATTLLAGCTSVTSAPPGTPLDQVAAQFGAPTLQCTDRDGLHRAVWSQQPMGQFAWASTIDGQGRIDTIQPVLTDEHFQVLKTGTWTAAQVRCEFGPPAIIDTAGLPGSQQVVWSYRYKQDHVWNSLMYVFMGQNGDQVTKFHPGPDPMYDHDRMFPRF